MIETKVRLSMSIPGAQMLSEQECSENPKENYQQETITVKYKKNLVYQISSLITILNFINPFFKITN